jgi:hypothetical protein
MIAALDVLILFPVLHRRLVNRPSLKLDSTSVLVSFEKFCIINLSRQSKETYKKELANILNNV